VVETLRLFLREGVQWRALRATGDRVCGATLRRRLREWSAVALLHRVHAVLVRMLRSGPQAAAAAWYVVIDSCSVRARRGGELTGPNPTDRATSGAPKVASTVVVECMARPVGKRCLRSELNSLRQRIRSQYLVKRSIYALTPAVASICATARLASSLFI
jgi:hypothetical protein